MIGTLTERHHLPMVAPAAILRCVGRIHSNVLPASLFRFAGEFPEEFRPRGIMNAFSEAVVMHHPVHVQIFHRNRTKAVYDLAAFLVCEIVPFETDTLMHAGYSLAMVPPLWCPLLQFGMFALDFRQSLFFFAKKARVFNLFTRRKCGKRCESNVNPNVGRKRRFALRVALDGKRGIPLAGRGAAYREGFDLPTDRAVVDHRNCPNLGDHNPVIVREGKARLREGEAIIAIFPLKAGVPWATCLFGRCRGMLTDTAEKCLERQVYPYSHILQDLRMDATEGGPFLFQYPKRVDLPVAGQGRSFLLPTITPFFKQMVIQPAAFLKNTGELLCLLFRWVYPVLEHFMHTRVVAQTEQECKWETALPLPQTRNGAHIPVAEARGFTRRFDNRAGSLLTRGEAGRVPS